MNIYGKAMGIKITKEATPSIVALIELVDKKSDKSAKNLKKVYFRKRPYVQLGETTPVPQWEKDSRKSSSYASHHSNLGWALSMVLAEVAPECQDEVLRIGFNYGYDRVIIGYHWASDVEAGRLLAAALVARMHADADFRQLIKQARAEYLKAL
jgi:acid phosphatase (class A)